MLGVSFDGTCVSTGCGEGVVGEGDDFGVVPGDGVNVAVGLLIGIGLSVGVSASVGMGVSIGVRVGVGVFVSSVVEVGKGSSSHADSRAAANKHGRPTLATCCAVLPNLEIDGILTPKMSDLSVAIVHEVCPGLTSLSTRWRHTVSVLRCRRTAHLWHLYDHFFSEPREFNRYRKVQPYSLLGLQRSLDCKPPDK